MWVVQPPGAINHNFSRCYYNTEEEAREKARSYPAGTEVFAEISSDSKEASASPERSEAPTPLEDSEPQTAFNFCLIAAKLVSGTRQNTYGDKRQNFAFIASVWNGYLQALARQRGGNCFLLEARHVGDLMELMKIARRHNGAYNPDDYIDAAGYAACTGEIVASDGKTD